MKFRGAIERRHTRRPIGRADGSIKPHPGVCATTTCSERRRCRRTSVFRSGKTGTTQAAGYCLIMGEKDADWKEYVSVVMHADSRDALYSDMSTIMEKIDR